MGFPLTSQIIESDPQLEDEFIRRRIAENYLIRDALGYNLNTGDLVILYNPP
jgi:hypothetical protein